MGKEWIRTISRVRKTSKAPNTTTRSPCSSSDVIVDIATPGFGFGLGSPNVNANVNANVNVNAKFKVYVCVKVSVSVSTRLAEKF